MTDTGQLPGEGQPGHADAQPEPPQHTAEAHGAYAYADPEGAQTPTSGDDEDLLMPGAQSAWSDGQPASGQYDVRAAAQPQQALQAQPGAPRRPLHLGPPVPEQSGAVRTLADRGPRTPGHAQPAAAAAERPETPDAPSPPPGPEYLDVVYQGTDSLPGPQLGEIPAQQEAWPASAQAAGAETVGQNTAAVPMPGPDLAAVPGQDTADEPRADGAGPADLQPGLMPASAPAAEPEAAQVPVPADEPLPEPQRRQPEPEAAQQPDTAGRPDSTEGPAAEAEPAPEPVTAPAAAEADPVATGAPPESGALHDTPDTTEAAPVTDPAAGVAAAEPASQEPASQAPEPEVADQVTAAPDDPQPAEAVAAEPGAGVDEAPELPQEPAPAEGAPADVASGTDTEAAGEPGPDLPVVPGPRAHEPDPPKATAEEAAAPAAAPEPEDTALPAEEPEAAEAPEAAEPEEAAPPISEDGPAADAAPSSDGAPGPEAAAPAPLPAAPGFDEADREAVHRLMRERRDIRNGFRSDPIPHEVLLRVLEAAHTAPSVGHSQPWDFVVIRSEATRRTMHELAQKQREAYAKSLPRARAKQFKELKVEAILDTPVNIVVTADPTRGGRHTLGRQTQPQMAPYSSALAVENLWLAARAEGLGVGWVSFFDEREMVRTLDLPDHLEVVAYLCIGYVDEFPAEPELMQAGWSKRRPLSWVVHEESYGRRALPGAEPHDLLAETLERIRPLDAKALGEAWERQKRMTKPPGALGMLEIISAQLCGLSRQCPPPVPEPAAVAVFAGDHGVHAQGVTPWPQEVTAQMVANFLGGGAVCNAFANQVGAEVCIVDVGVAAELPATPGLLPRKVRPGTADMTRGPALTREEVLRAIEVGIETARDLVAAGNKGLVTGEMGIANTTASAALIAVCTGADPAEVTGRGTGIDDDTHTRKVDVVRRALQLHRPDPADPVGMLAAVGGLEHAALTGLILGGASLRTPVILDGVSAGAAALVARQIAPEALAACIAGHRSAEPGHVAALTKLGLRPLIDLDLRLGEGTGALLALPMVQSAARAMHEVATFDSAGVTEKN